VPLALGSPRSRRIVPKSVLEQVHDAVLQAIFERRFRPGDRVIESALAKELGVAQATVNQVLFDLDSKGVVSKTPNKETRISRFSYGEIETLFTIRNTLESLAVEAVAKLADAETEERLRFWVEEMRTAERNKDTSRFYIADYRFHQQLYQESKNPVIIRACQAVAVAPFAYLLTGSKDDLIPINYQVMVSDHEEIVDAAMKGPSEAVAVVQSKVEKWLNTDLSYLRDRAQ
jgi:DNA-binding GntR family transcriptional regulator